jgi:hypothetical protein
MSDTPITELEQQLTALTAWAGPAPGLWRRSLAASRSGAKRAGRCWRLTGRVPGWVWGVSAAAVIFIAIGLAMQPRTARMLGIEFLGGMDRRIALTPDAGRGSESRTDDRFEFKGYSYESYGYQIPFGRNAKPNERLDARVALAADKGPFWQAGATDANTGSLTDRQVVRKAQVELLAKDVRAAFLKASHLISEAQGEYVQDSSVTGSGDRVEANLTLRVAATRLADVLNDLRGLGEVRSEQTGGEDVTGQVVDVEARLRNEKQVEAELLKLLESRQNAPLKEILDVRTSLGNVRQTIEQLTAQREKLGRLVSLATVLVIIRPADAPPPKPPPGLAAYLGQSLLDGLHRGALFLINTLATIVGVLVGGLVWWVLLVAAILIVRGYRRRRSATAG